MYANESLRRLNSMIKTENCKSTGLAEVMGLSILARYKMLAEMGLPETTIWEYPMADDSWKMEITEFLDGGRLQRQPASSLADAIVVLRIVDKVYMESGYDHCT